MYMYLCISLKMCLQKVNSDTKKQSTETKNKHLVSSPSLVRNHSAVNDRYLKAVIGSQEFKIQELCTKLCELNERLSEVLHIFIVLLNNIH